MQRVSNARLRNSDFYFPYIAYVFVCFYYVRRSVLFKIHAADIEALKFFCVFLSVMENISKDFPNASSMYSYNFHIFFSFASESRVARNTILIQRAVL